MVFLHWIEGRSCVKLNPGNSVIKWVSYQFFMWIWVENVPHGPLHHSDVTEFVVLRASSQKRAEDASAGRM